jgi:hypothetical protein
MGSALTEIYMLLKAEYLNNKTDVQIDAIELNFTQNSELESNETTNEIL